jgi:hypothetical protein
MSATSRTVWRNAINALICFIALFPTLQGGIMPHPLGIAPEAASSSSAASRATAARYRNTGRAGSPCPRTCRP